MYIEFIIFIIIFIVIINVFYKSVKNDNTIYIKSNIDNKLYLVKNLTDKQSAADLLADIHNNMILLVDYLYKHKDDKFKENKEYIYQLKKKIDGIIISENNDGNNNTSYSINKGEQIVFCIRSKKNIDKLHNINLLMYVTIHELAHVACPEYGHTPLFKDIFYFLIKAAIEINIYKKVDFKNNPLEYCGIIINDSII